jgi:hypothetical protein
MQTPEVAWEFSWYYCVECTRSLSSGCEGFPNLLNVVSHPGHLLLHRGWVGSRGSGGKFDIFLTPWSKCVWRWGLPGYSNLVSLAFTLSGVCLPLGLCTLIHTGIYGEKMKPNLCSDLHFEPLLSDCFECELLNKLDK